MTPKQLGEIRREFKPSPANQVAGIIIGLLLLGGGGFLIYFPAQGILQSRGQIPLWSDVPHQWSWIPVGVMAAIGAGMISFGVGLLRWIAAIASLRVRLCNNGLAVIDHTALYFSWDEIVLVQETHLFERPPLLKGPAEYILPKVMSQSFLVALKSGVSFGFDGNTIQGHLELAKLIRQQTDPRHIPWQIREEHG